MARTRGPSTFPGTSRFEVLRLLGEGGMGVVYEALDREQNALVALKTLRAVEPEALLRFKQEFRTVRDVAHPNLVRLGELIEDAGRWFFTMELLEGKDLLSYVRSGDDERGEHTPLGTPAPMRTPESTPTETARTPSGRAPTPPRSSADDAVTADTAEVARLGALAEAEAAPPAAARGFSEARLRDAFAQLAEGLEGLHRSNLVHRDVKPSNVMVAPGGRVVILDFGIATDVTGMDDDELLGLGTAAFMAPEQSLGVVPLPASDWYAVGVTLYQALTGQVPHRGRTMEELRDRKRHVAPRSPHQLCEAVPRDLEELCLALLDPDPARRPAGADVVRLLRAGSGKARPAERRRKPVQPTFFGRVAELEALADALAASRAGGSVAVIVTGDSGIGKSALVRRFSDLTRAQHPEALLLSGRCHERESVPYKAVDGVIDALSRHLRRLDRAEAEALLPASIGAVAQVFPVLAELDVIAQRSEEAPVLVGSDLRRRVFGALRELFARLAERAPLVLLIDDLQWADADSLALLEELLRPPGPRLLLVATRRGPADSPVDLGRVELRRIHVRPLGDADAQQLARRYLGEEDAARAGLAETLVRESTGHPLFIVELAQHLSGGGEQPSAAAGDEPPGATQVRLDEALRQRMGRLEEPTRRVLELVAMAGVPLPQALVAELLRMPFAELAGRVATLRAGRLLSISGPRPTDRVEPYHDRISESLRAGLGPAATREWHRRLAETLEPLPSTAPELLSAHFAGAGDARRAARHAVRAAEEATRALAFERSARLYGRAFELLGSVALPEDAAELLALEVAHAAALTDAGRTRAAAEVYERAAAHAPADQALDLRRRAGQAYLVSGEIERGVDTLSGLLGALGLSPPRSRNGLLLSIGLMRARIRLRGLRYRERDAAEVPPEVLLELDLAWAANLGLAYVDVLLSTWFQQRFILKAFAVGERGRLIRGLVAEAGVSASGGSRTLVRTAELVARIDALAARIDRPYERGLAATIRTICAQLEGRYPLMARHAEETIEILGRAGYSSNWELDTMRTLWVHSLFFTGRTREMVERSEEYLRAARDRGDRYEITLLSTGSPNHVWLVRGDSAMARRMADEVVAGWPERGTLVHVAFDLVAQASIDLYEDPEGERAWRRIVKAWDSLRREFLLSFEAARVVYHDLRARAAVAAALRASASEARARLRAAEKSARALAREQAPPAPAHADAIRAAILHQRGDARGALHALRAAAQGFDAAGMRLHAHAARRRLGALVGGDEGAALVRAADAAMSAEAIADPARMMGMLVPGFAEP